MLSTIIIPTLIVGSIGAIFALLLAYSSDKFKVEVDERIPKVRECLPSANCGGCGYPGCDAYAEGVVNEGADITLCAPGGTACIEKLSEIMGKSAENFDPTVAFVRCNGTNDNTKAQYIYDGIKLCSEAELMPGRGNKECAYACLGYGDCVTSCKFGAIDIVNGVAVIYPDLCTACGSCVNACPKNIIHMIPKKSVQRIRCVNPEKGKAVIDACFTGCTGCTLCSKVCPVNAITMENNLPTFNYDLCTSCGICEEKCPRKSISHTKYNKPVILNANVEV